MKNKRKIVLLTWLLLSVLLGKAQSNLVFYHTTDQFNSSNFNPAFLVTQKKFTFSIFPLSGMSVGYNNQVVIKDMLKTFLRGDTAKSAYNGVFNSLVDRGLFYQRFETSLLNLGYHSDIGSFNFRIREIEQFMNNFKSDFTEFILNPSFQTISFNQPQTLPAEAYHYREYSLGYAREIIKNKLTLGIRAKLYFGKANFISEVSGKAVRENDNFYLRTDGFVHLSVPVNMILENGNLQPFILNDNFTSGNYLLNSKNIGTGVDLGLSYRINPQLMISASAIDLGKINWKNNLNTMAFRGEIEFPAEFIEESGTEFLTKKPGFTIENNFDLFKVDTAKIAYSTQLPANYFVGIHYQLNPNLTIGVVDRFITARGMNFNSFSITGTFNLKKNLTINTGYSILGNSLNNIPLGIIYNWDTGQYFIGTDNILSFIVPSISDFSGITFGACFYLFRKNVKYREQLEYLPFYKEKKANPDKKRGLIF